MKSRYLSLLASILIVVFLMSGCSLLGGGEESEGSEQSNTQIEKKETDFDNPDYLAEQDGAKIVSVSHPEEDFIGKWEARSDYSEYLYGNVSLTINSNHTWNGNITNENFAGKWAVGKPGIFIKDTEGIIEWNLFFIDDGNLVFKNLDDPEVTIVLSKAGI